MSGEHIEFQIKAPATREASEYEVSSVLMPLYFRTIIYAPSSSGKGVLLNNLIGSGKFPYKKIFGKNIFIFSSTFSLGDDSLEDIDVPAENVYSTLDEAVLREILEEQKGNIAEYGKKKCPALLFVFDDVLSQISSKKASVLREIFYSGRHYKINILMLVQSYKGVAKPMRTNSTHSIFFAIDNQKEREVIKEEQNADPKVFDEILKDATEEKYSFLVVNHKAQKQRRFQLRFTNQYYDPSNYK